MKLKMLPFLFGVFPDVMAYRTNRSPGCGYEYRTETHRGSRYGYINHTELTEVRALWRGRTEATEVPGRYQNVVRVPRILCLERTDLTELQGTRMNIVQDLQQFRYE